MISADLFDGRCLRVAEDESLSTRIAVDEGICSDGNSEGEQCDSDTEFHLDRAMSWVVNECM